MDGTDKVIIALGFFTLVGFIVYCVMVINTTAPLVSNTGYVTVAELKQARQEMRSGR